MLRFYGVLIIIIIKIRNLFSDTKFLVKFQLKIFCVGLHMIYSNSKSIHTDPHHYPTTNQKVLSYTIQIYDFQTLLTANIKSRLYLKKFIY